MPAVATPCAAVGFLVVPFIGLAFSLPFCTLVHGSSRFMCTVLPSVSGICFMTAITTVVG